jgi:hypothetical protein
MSILPFKAAHRISEHTERVAESNDGLI